MKVVSSSPNSYCGLFPLSEASTGGLSSLHLLYITSFSPGFSVRFFLHPLHRVNEASPEALAVLLFAAADKHQVSNLDGAPCHMR